MFSILANSTSHHHMQQKEQQKEESLERNNNLKEFLLPKQGNEATRSRENHDFRWFREHYSSPKQHASQFDKGGMPGAVPSQQSRERQNGTIRVNGSQDQSLLVVALEAFDLPPWSSLTWVERMLLPLAVVLAPFLVYYIESLCVSVASALTTIPILGSQVLTEGILVLINTQLWLNSCMTSLVNFFQHELNRSINEKVAIVALATLIIIVFDADPITNNERLLRICERITGTVATVNEGRKFKFSHNSVDSSSIYLPISLMRVFMGGINYVLRSFWSQFPRVGKWGIVFIGLSAVMRLTVYCTATRLKEAFVFMYPWLRSGILVLISCFTLFRVVSWKLSQRASWFRAIEQIGGVAKLILAKHGRAYPIEYIKEEIAELILQFRRPSKTSLESAKLLLSPLSVPSKTFRSALGCNDCDSAVNEIKPVSSLDESQGIAAYMETVDSLTVDSIQKLWPAVVQWVQKDRRIQRLDLMVDGSRQACWRVLSGKTAAWF